MILTLNLKPWLMVTVLNFLKNLKTIVIHYGFNDVTKKTSKDIILKHGKFCFFWDMGSSLPHLIKMQYINISA